MTNPIARSSIVMAKCVKSFEQRQNANKKQQQQSLWIVWTLKNGKLLIFFNI